MVEAASVIIWLCLGGWAFRKLAAGENSKTIGGLFIFCILLAPFAFGSAIADLNRRPPKGHLK
jgi:hypothetical protein